MMYSILEGNMEKVEKKVKTIQNKCRKFGCDFRFDRIGEEYKEVEIPTADGRKEKTTLKFILVEAEGKAVINGWQFAGCIETTEHGNIFRKAINNVEVPERYYHSGCICEHCGSKRNRKETYLVFNETTGEWKQVGKTCLKDFTNGMSPEAIAAFYDGLEYIYKGEAPWPGMTYQREILTEEYLHYVAETIHHFGYVKGGTYGMHSTASKATDFYGLDHGWFCGYWGKAISEEIRKEKEACKFDASSEFAKEKTKEVLDWLDRQEEKGDYIHNLKVAVANKYITAQNMGLLASLFPVADKALEREARLRKERASGKLSEHVGEIGQRIEFDVSSAKLLTSWGTQWGITFMWRFTDDKNNIYIWKTSTDFDSEKVRHLKGTIKDHGEFNGIKQTELTRCKLTA